MFHPTLAEFADPLAYIKRIEPEASRAGICRIVPPAGWRPPFSVDPDAGKFCPRLQDLSEIGGPARCEAAFIRELRSFSSDLAVPTHVTLKIGRSDRTTSIWSLFRSVVSRGGVAKVNRATQEVLGWELAHLAGESSGRALPVDDSSYSLVDTWVGIAADLSLVSNESPEFDLAAQLWDAYRHTLLKYEYHCMDSGRLGRNDVHSSDIAVSGQCHTEEALTGKPQRCCAEHPASSAARDRIAASGASNTGASVSLLHNVRVSVAPLSDAVAFGGSEQESQVPFGRDVSGSAPEVDTARARTKRDAGSTAGEALSFVDERESNCTGDGVLSVRTSAVRQAEQGRASPAGISAGAPVGHKDSAWVPGASARESQAGAPGTTGAPPLLEVSTGGGGSSRFCRLHRSTLGGTTVFQPRRKRSRNGSQALRVEEDDSAAQGSCDYGTSSSDGCDDQEDGDYVAEQSGQTERIPQLRRTLAAQDAHACRYEPPGVSSGIESTSIDEVSGGMKDARCDESMLAFSAPAPADVWEGEFPALGDFGSPVKENFTSGFGVVAGYAAQGAGGSSYSAPPPKRPRLPVATVRAAARSFVHHFSPDSQVLQAGRHSALAPCSASSFLAEYFPQARSPFRGTSPFLAAPRSRVNVAAAAARGVSFFRYRDGCGATRAVISSVVPEGASAGDFLPRKAALTNARVTAARHATHDCVVLDRAPPSSRTLYSLQYGDGSVEVVSNGTASMLLANGDSPLQSVSAHGSPLCQQCLRCDWLQRMLTCRKCERRFHDFCVLQSTAPMHSAERWICGTCFNPSVRVDGKRPTLRVIDYGFDDSTECSLRRFRHRALGWQREFCANFARRWGKPLNSADVEAIEAEYWRIVEAGIREPRRTIVEYGSDVDTQSFGSGFPTVDQLSSSGTACTLRSVSWAESVQQSARSWSNPPTLAQTERCSSDEARMLHYATSAWNLNILPTSAGSLLQYLSSSVTGVSVPWLYVGSMLSSFCWHNEDHYFYSINFNHLGAAKVWYGVSGDDAAKFEDACARLAPELFRGHPGLLHQIVTMVPPVALMEAGIRVVRAVQSAGEFIVTFPAAYHAGFNTGFNVAEAVNFAIPSWLPWARRAEEHYTVTHRMPVFSREKLILRLASAVTEQPPRESLDTALLVRDELQLVISAMQRFLSDVAKLGYVNFAPMADLSSSPSGMTHVRNRGSGAASSSMRGFSASAGSMRATMRNTRGVASGLCDEGWLCCVCRQYCYLVAARCGCSRCRAPGTGIGPRHVGQKIVCRKHLTELCPSGSAPSDCWLYFRHTADELAGLVDRVTYRVDGPAAWYTTRDALLAGEHATLSRLSRAVADAKALGLSRRETSSLAVRLQDAKAVEDEVSGVLSARAAPSLETLVELLSRVEALPFDTPAIGVLRDTISSCADIVRETAVLLGDSSFIPASIAASVHMPHGEGDRGASDDVHVVARRAVARPEHANVVTARAGCAALRSLEARALTLPVNLTDVTSRLRARYIGLEWVALAEPAVESVTARFRVFQVAVHAVNKCPSHPCDQNDLTTLLCAASSGVVVNDSRVCQQEIFDLLSSLDTAHLPSRSVDAERSLREWMTESERFCVYFDQFRLGDSSWEQLATLLARSWALMLRPARMGELEQQIRRLRPSSHVPTRLWRHCTGTERSPLSASNAEDLVTAG